MTNHHKQFYKRIFCLVLMLAIAAAYIPDFTPKAQAAPGGVGVLRYAPKFMQGSPSIPGLGQLFDMNISCTPNHCTLECVDPVLIMIDPTYALGCMFYKYIALNETMTAALRAAGIQYVETSPLTGVYAPTDELTENMVRHIAESTVTVYNSLDAAAQSEIWQQAQNLAGAWASGAQSIVQFGSDLISKVQGKHKELYPATNVQYFNGVSVGDVQGLTVNELINIIPISEIDSDGYIIKFIHISNPVRLYRANGTFVDYTNSPLVNSNEIPLVPLIRYNYHTTLGWKFFYIGWNIKNLNTGRIFFRGGNPVEIGGFYFTPLAKIANDAPPIPAGGVTITMPTIPGMDIETWLKRLAEINAMSGADVWNPEAENPQDKIWDGKAAAQRLRDMLVDYWTWVEYLAGLFPNIDFSDFIRRLKELHGTIPDSVTEAQYKALKEIIDGQRDLINTGDLTQEKVDGMTQEIDGAKIIAGSQTDTGAGTDTDTDTGADLKPITFPHVFPFCIPFDIADILKSFRATSKAPIFDVSLPLLPNSAPAEFTLDLTVISPVMPILRFFILIFFALGLAKLTSRVIKW